MSRTADTTRPAGIFSVSAATVTLDEGRVLLIRRADNGQWQIPGGVVELGEQPPAAAARETLEETGIEVSVGDCTGVYTNVARGICAFVFRAAPVSGTVSTSAETTEVGWFTAAEAMGMVSEVFRPRIADALHAAGTVTFRGHDGQSMLF